MPGHKNQYKADSASFDTPTRGPIPSSLVIFKNPLERMHVQLDDETSQTSTKLYQLPPELFNHLAAFFGGRDVIKLLATGNKALTYLMGARAGVTTFECRTGPSYSFLPFLFRRLTKLKRLVLTQRARTCFFDGQRLLGDLPPSVQELELGNQFDSRHLMAADRDLNRFAKIDDFKTTPTLLDNFPELHTLKIHSESYIIPFILQSLPSSVTKLVTTGTDPEDDRHDYVVYTLPQYWPANLLHLELSQHYRLHDSGETVWPTNLQTLRILHLDTDAGLLPSHFPTTLTDLSMRRIYKANFMMEDELETECKFYANLKRLQVITSTPHAIMQCVEESQLETLIMDNGARLLGSDEILYLPKGLKTFSAHFSTKADASVYQHLPRTLTSFTLVWPHEDPWQINDTRLANLPEILTHFHVTHSTVFNTKFAAFLPRSLTHCPLASKASYTPSGLRDLPRGLRELVFDTKNSHLSYTNSVISLLPSGLTTLKIEMSENFLTDIALGNLPRTLKMFVHSTNTNFSNLGMKLLPTGLEHLHLPKNDAIGDSGIRDLPPLLKTLILLGNDIMLTAKCFELLPRSLLGLSLHHVGNVSDISFSKLPQLLETLILPGVNKISNKAMDHMPRLLRRLVLTSVTTFTLHVVKKVRPSLEYLYIKDNAGFKELKRKMVPKHLSLVTKNIFFRSDVYNKADKDNKIMTALIEEPM
jgi:hypothetical protein